MIGISKNIGVWLSGVVLLGACNAGQLEGVVDGEAAVARYRLNQDALGALRLSDCVEGGDKDCTAYPNPAGCEELDVTVRANGKAFGICDTADRSVVLGSFLEGLPFACAFDKERSCVVCKDAFGKTILERCFELPEPPKAPGFGDASIGQGTIPPIPRPGSKFPDAGVALPDLPKMPSPGSDAGMPKWPGSDGMPEIPRPTPTPDGDKASAPGIEQGQTPGGAASDACSPAGVHKAYADKLNELLAKEGLTFSFNEVPETAPAGSPFGGAFGGGAFGGGAFNICASDEEDAGIQGFDLPSAIEGMRSGCDSNAKAQGRCYCYDGVAPTCRCGRITNQVLKAMCAVVAPCEGKDATSSLWNTHSAANRWLNNVSGDSVMRSDRGGKLETLDGPGQLLCLGSPLVLDTAGDGIKPTSLNEGVSFPLATGVSKTAWIQGDDALLVLDANGNGRIDDGSELFGEHNAANGFAALARLDDVAQGGNGNGLVEAGDLFFGQLQAWKDRNGDGVSQQDELQSLSALGIVALEISAIHQVGMHDRHGNDLGLRARFHRANGGTGSLVDVLFTTSSK